MKKLLIGALTASLSLSVMAVDITVNNTACGGGLTAQNCADLDAEIRSSLGDDLPEANIDDYAVGIANANNFAQNGTNSDYSDRFTYFTAKINGGLAVQGEVDDPGAADGIGIGGGLSFGLNLDLLPVDKIGPVDLSKMDLFVSFLSYNADQDNDDLTLEGKISSFSVMARYQIMEGKDIVPGYMLEWGGVFLHTGFRRSTMKIEAISTFDNEEVEVDGNTAEITDTTVGFEIDSTTMSIPVEVSTYLRAAWAFTFFGGAGFDFVTGSTDVDLTADGTANLTSGGTYTSDISASEDGSGDAEATNFRAFGGLQVNLPFTRVYVQATKGLGNDLIGVNAGLKVLW